MSSNDPITTWGSLQTPYSQEAEEACLGAIITNPETFRSCRQVISSPQSFFILRHRYIWQALETLEDVHHRPIDYLTVCEQLRADGHLAEIGGAAYITQLTLHAPTSTHAAVYAELVERYAVRRTVMEISDLLKQLAVDESMVVEDVVQQSKDLVLGIRPPILRREMPSMHDVMSMIYDEFEERVNKGVNTKGVPTGYRRLNELLGGWRKKRLHIVGGRPGMGKSLIMLLFALKVAMQRDPLTGRPYNVALYTLEMSNGEIGERALSNDTGMTTRQILEPAMSSAQIKQVTKGIAKLQDVSLYMEDSLPRMKPSQLRESCLDFIATHKHLDLVVVDYLQLMGGDGYSDNRQVEIAGISGAMKALCNELDIPMITGSQLNREVENREDKRPQLSDLRDSGAIEQDADVVLFPYFDNYYNNPEDKQGQYEIRVAKQRNGPLGTQYGDIDFRTMSYEEY